MYEQLKRLCLTGDTVQIASGTTPFHCALAAAVSKAEMARVHCNVTDRIRVIGPLLNPSKC